MNFKIIIICILFQITNTILYPSDKNSILQLSKWNNKSYKSDATDKITLNEEYNQIHEALNYNRKNYRIFKKKLEETEIHTDTHLMLYNKTPEGFTSSQQAIIDNLTKKTDRIKRKRILWATIQNDLFLKKEQKTIPHEEFIAEQKKVSDNFKNFIKSISSELKHQCMQIAMQKAKIIEKEADLIHFSIKEKEANLMRETKINPCLIENASQEITKNFLNEKNENLLQQNRSQPKLLKNQTKTTQYYNNSNISAEKNCHCTIM